MRTRAAAGVRLAEPAPRRRGARWPTSSGATAPGCSPTPRPSWTERGRLRRALVERRAAGEPVAYIRGFKEWHSLRIRTDARALIPRPETELLADAAIAEIAARLARDDRPVVAWDVATGSGAVAVALALRFRAGAGARPAGASSPATCRPRRSSWPPRTSPRTASAASSSLACADLLEPAGEPLPRPDVVIANLPYVSSAEVDERRGLARLRAAHRARRRRRTASTCCAGCSTSCRSRPRPGRRVLLEIGVGPGDAVRRPWRRRAHRSRSCPDLAGLDRVVRIGCDLTVTDRLPPTPEGIARAAELLRDGELVAFPTDTVYGVGVAGVARRTGSTRSSRSSGGRPSRRIPMLVADLDAGRRGRLGRRRAGASRWPSASGRAP